MTVSATAMARRSKNTVVSRKATFSRLSLVLRFWSMESLSMSVIAVSFCATPYSKVSLFCSAPQY